MKTIICLLASVVSLNAATSEFWMVPDVFVPATSQGAVMDVRQAFPIGSQQNPYNGCSDASRFDATISLLPTNALIHLSPGIFESSGSNPKQGQRIVGAGKYLTTIRYPASVIKAWSGQGGSHWMFQPASPYTAHDVEIEDLTVDGNYQAGSLVTLNGIALWGSGNSIRHVRLINCASYTANSDVTNYHECFGLIMASGAIYDFDEAGNNNFEDCEVSGYTQNFNNNMTPMGFGSQAHGRILNCQLENTIVNGTNDMLGFAVSASDTIIQGCYVWKNHDGLHFDTGKGWTNLTVIGCFFDVSWMQDFHNANFAGIRYTGNTITLENFKNKPPYTAYINMQAGDATISGIYSSGNRISIVPSTNSFPAYYAVMQNVSGFVSTGDFIDAGCSNQIVNSTNITINSYDLFGKAYQHNQAQ